jgi:hypothetical protein
MSRVARKAQVVISIVAASFVALSLLSAVPAQADVVAPTIVSIPLASPSFQVAIDDGAVATMSSDGVAVRNVAFADSTLSDATTLGTKSFNVCSRNSGDSGGTTLGAGRCSALTQSDGMTAWSEGLGTIETNSPGGSPLTFSTPYAFPVQTSAVSGKWVIDATQYVVDMAAKTSVGPLSNLGGNDLLHGDLYIPGEVERSTMSDVLVRNLSTGAGATVPVPECSDVENVQAAGTWLLVTCMLPDLSQSYVVVDRTGGTTDRILPITGDPTFLGNGFLAIRHRADSTVQWTPLTGDLLNWSTIGTAPNSQGGLAVSRGSQPTLAWIDSSGVVSAALLPVQASPAAPQPQSGVGLPSAPAVSTEGFVDHVQLSWPAAPASEGLTGYVIQAPGQSRPIILPPNATGYQVTGLQFGTTGYVFLKAENANGSSASQEIPVTLQSQYPQAVDSLTATLNQSTGVVTVEWHYTQQDNTDAPVSWNVAAGPYAKSGLAADTRSTTIQLGAQNATPVTLTAVGPRASSTWRASLVNWGRYVNAAPTVAISGLPPVTLGSGFSAIFTATEGIAIPKLDVRERVAGRNTPFGAWTYPATAQGATGTATTTVTGAKPGASYCFETRTTDIDGLQSDWSSPSCTAIAIDDRALSRSGKWISLKNSAYFHGTGSESLNTSSRLSTSIRASQVWILATTCATCGNLGLRLGGTTVWVSLHSRTTQYQVAVSIPWGAKINHSISIVQRWTSKRVHIDGIAYVGY